MRIAIGFVAGLVFGLAVALYTHHATLTETDIFFHVSNNEAYIGNHLAYLERDDAQLRCAIARDVQSSYQSLRDIYPITEFLFLGKITETLANELARISMEEYDHSGIEEVVRQCPKFEYDCSNIEYNLEALLCGGDGDA